MKSTPIRCRSVPYTANIRRRILAPRPDRHSGLACPVQPLALSGPMKSKLLMPSRTVFRKKAHLSDGPSRRRLRHALPANIESASSRVLPARTYLADEICTNLDTWTGSLPKESTSIGQTVTQMPQPIQEEFELSRIS